MHIDRIGLLFVTRTDVYVVELWGQQMGSESCEGVEQVEIGHAVHLRSLSLYGSENVPGLYASDRSL